MLRVLKLAPFGTLTTFSLYKKLWSSSQQYLSCKKGPASVDKSLDKCLGAESRQQPAAKSKSETG